MKIIYLPYEKIDKSKWDHCLQQSINKLIYAESVYLDTMCAQWDAIVLDNYDAIMPLPWRKKMGIKYLYQPAFLQQGGIFSNKELPNEIIEAFIDKASQHFKFAELSLNFLNTIEYKSNSPFSINLRNNFILSLENKFEINIQNYSNDFKRKLKKTDSSNLSYFKSTDFKEAIQFYKKTYKDRKLNVTTKDYANFEELCKFYQNKKRVIIRKVVNNQNKIMSIVLMLKDQNRLYNLLPCVTEEGKNISSNYFLYHSIIEEFSGKIQTMDLEGSDIKGIAEFYQKMTKTNQPYPFIKINNLPRVVKLLKK